jgi:putative transcriptional regulator
MESLKGKLLLASAMLKDPNFARTVVLMVQHDENGALGLVLNRPLAATVRETIEASLGQSFAVEGNLHQGGPCDSPLMVLHTNPEQSQIEVLEGVHFAAERPKIESILLTASEPAKFFLGCSGWAPGQLEAELKQGAWQRIVAEATLSPYIDIDMIPDDPTVN